MRNLPGVVLGLLIAVTATALDGDEPCNLTPLRLPPGRAPAHALRALAAAGPALVRRIVLIRSILPLRRPGQLRWVPGVGGRRLHQWWPWLSADGG